MVECMPWFGMTQVITNQATVYEITELTKNVKNTHKYTECLMYKLFMIIWTN